MRHFPFRRSVVRWVGVGAAVWGLSVSGWAADGDAVTQAMREALYAEEVTGDVAGALKAYEAVTARFEEQRDLAATALFRQGECLRKLERPQEAAAVYRRVLTLFPDKERLVRLSRENLVALGQSVPESAGAPTAAAGAAGLSEDEQKEWNRVREMARNSPDLLFDEGGNAFLTAASKGHLAVLDWFLREQSAGATPHLRAAAGRAVKEGQLKACELLLAAGAPTTGLLVEALQHQRWSVVRLLLASKADVAEKSQAPAKWVTPGGTNAVRGPVLVVALGMDTMVPPDVVADLLKAGADPNAVGVMVESGQAVTPLSIAVRRGGLDRLTVLLQGKADPNALVGEPGRTALMLALESSSDQAYAMVDLLTGAGADWKTRAPDGWTALHSAATSGQARWVEAAVAAGVDVNAATEAGLTPLMQAQTSERGHGAVPALLQAGATVVSVHPKLGNVLARACQRWPREPAALQALEALLKAGADPNTPATDDGPALLPLVAAVGFTDTHWSDAWPAAVEVLLAHQAMTTEIEGFEALMANVRSSLLPGLLGGGPEGRVREIRERVVAVFRPLWKARHQRENEQLMNALWWDEGEAWLAAVMTMSPLLNADEQLRPQFSAVLGVESAIDGSPTLRQFIRQCLLMNIIRPRQWEKAVLTRRDGGAESVVPIDLVAIAEGRQEAPEVRWGDVVSVPYKPGTEDDTDLRVQGWAMGEARISLRLDLGAGGVVSNRPERDNPLWDVVTTAGTPQIPLATVIRQAGVPVDVLNLGVIVRRVDGRGTFSDKPVNWNQPPTLVDGDIVAFSIPEVKPSLSEEALRGGIWVCPSMEGPFWRINAQIGTDNGPALGYLLLALQAPRPGPAQRVDWSKARLRSWIPQSEEAVANGEVPAAARWEEASLMAVWSTTRMRQGQILILPGGDGATAELPAELKAGLEQLGFEWKLQIDTLAPVSRSYRPRFFSRRLVEGRTVWSDEREDGPSGPLLPLKRDLLAMTDVVSAGLSSDRDPVGRLQFTMPWVEADAVVEHFVSIEAGTTPSGSANINPLAPPTQIEPPGQRRRVVLPPVSYPPK